MSDVPDFDQIVSRYQERIARYLTGLLGDPILAQDLSQETFIRVHGNLENLRSPEALTNWIFRIASNLALDHLRSRRSHESRRTESLNEDSLDDRDGNKHFTGDEVSAESRLEQHEMAACIRGYIERLPEMLRACVMLRDLEDLPEKDVAEIIGCSLATVKVRTHRGRKKLREMLREGCDLYQDSRGILRCEPGEPPVSDGGRPRPNRRLRKKE
ncbi:MAG: sigma-70 family RNA polymerase sigma factor [Rhodospirillales bacterium]|nr:sigma-70 family RNA polymerase sigma factor [Rhodospirillales bacterium]